MLLYVVYLCACVHVWYAGVLVLYVYLSICMYVCLSMYVRWHICVYSVWMCVGYVFCVWYVCMLVCLHGTLLCAGVRGASTVKTFRDHSSQGLRVKL